jgi:hypothetical protein
MLSRDLFDSYLSELGKLQESMAASMEVIDYMVDFVKRHQVCSILDAGSGLSSLYLHKEFLNVSSVDDSIEWAKKSEELILKYVGKQVLVGRNISGKYDLVFYDYGNIETRIFYFKQAMASAKKYMIIDDVHVSYYRDYIQQVTAGKELVFLPQTVDKYGRYSALLVL